MVNLSKPRRPLRKTFLKEWREHAGLTQERASERLNMDRSNLSRVERGQIPYTQQLLEAAAVAYSCEPHELLTVNPLKERDVIDFTAIIRDASPEVRAEILGYAKGRIGKPN